MPSSVIRKRSYDRERQLLEITFVSGRIYVYEDVPEQVYAAFSQAMSKGEFFNRHIRDYYSYREVTSAA